MVKQIIDFFVMIVHYINVHLLHLIIIIIIIITITNMRKTE